VAALALAAERPDEFPADELSFTLLSRRAERVRDSLAHIVEDHKGRVTWFENAGGGPSLSSCPVDVSERLRVDLFDSVPALVLTSATLTHGKSKPEKPGAGFEYLRRRLGLVDLLSPVDELVCPTPFDIVGNALLYVPKDLAEPGAVSLSALAERVRELLEITAGGAFVLTTSLRAMRGLHRELARQNLGLNLMLQGQAGKEELIQRFRDDGNAVLVATFSFWEGVDVPGR
jgi:ATP-dependent DNA helicase DinG